MFNVRDRHQTYSKQSLNSKPILNYSSRGDFRSKLFSSKPRYKKYNSQTTRTQEI